MPLQPRLQSKVNCDECKNLISAFMDDELDEVRSADLTKHLAACIECSGICEHLASVLDICTTDPPAELVQPKNSKNIWLRIHNIIECEKNAEAAPPPAESARRGFWRLSFWQLVAAVLSIALISSLVTVVVIRKYTQSAAEDLTTRSAATQTTFEKVLGRIGLMETPQQARDRRIKEQQAAIEYWNTRVQARREQWDHYTRDAFDRNLKVIDDSLNDYSMILQQDPDDELSGEMLDSVLNDKMNLLRDFSDL